MSVRGAASTVGGKVRECRIYSGLDRQMLCPELHYIIDEWVVQHMIFLELCWVEGKVQWGVIGSPGCLVCSCIQDVSGKM